MMMMMIMIIIIMMKMIKMIMMMMMMHKMPLMIDDIISTLGHAHVPETVSFHSRHLSVIPLMHLERTVEVRMGSLN